MLLFNTASGKLRLIATLSEGLGREEMITLVRTARAVTGKVGEAVKVSSEFIPLMQKVSGKPVKAAVLCAMLPQAPTSSNCALSRRERRQWSRSGRAARH